MSRYVPPHAARSSKLDSLVIPTHPSKPMMRRRDSSASSSSSESSSTYTGSTSNSGSYSPPSTPPTSIASSSRSSTPLPKCPLIQPSTYTIDDLVTMAHTPLSQYHTSQLGGTVKANAPEVFLGRRLKRAVDWAGKATGSRPQAVASAKDDTIRPKGISRRENGRPAATRAASGW